MEGRINDDESIFADVTFDPGGKLHAGASADRCLVSRSGLCLRGCGFGSVASGLRGFGAGGLQSWTFMQVKGLLV